MLGFGGFCWDLLGFVGACWDLLGFAGIYWDLLEDALSVSFAESGLWATWVVLGVTIGSDG